RHAGLRARRARRDCDGDEQPDGGVGDRPAAAACPEEPGGEGKDEGAAAIAVAAAAAGGDRASAAAETAAGVATDRRTDRARRAGATIVGHGSRGGFYSWRFAEYGNAEGACVIAAERGAG